MPLLQVRDVPVDLYETLTQVAKNENRSVAQQTVVLLKTALNLHESRRSRKAATLKELALLNIEGVDDFPSPELLIREDRDR